MKCNLFEKSPHFRDESINATNNSGILFFFFSFIYLFYFTILYLFFQTLTWICHRCTWFKKTSSCESHFNSTLKVKWSRSVMSDSLRPLWTVAYQDPPSMGFSRQGYWSGLPLPSSGIFLTQGSNPSLPHCRQMLYSLNHQGSTKQTS